MLSSLLRRVGLYPGVAFAGQAGYKAPRSGKDMADIKQKLMDYSELDPGTGCRLWNRYYDRSGYGRVRYQGKTRFAHRVAYQVFVGPIPEGLCVLHSCHTPACINPDHLRVGTPKDNAEDRVRAGRNALCSGENHGRAKLTLEKAHNIRQTYSSGNYTQSEVGSLFGVGQQLISRIVRGERWKESASS